MNEEFFVATNKATPTEPRTLRQSYARRVKKLGLPQIKFHGLRHTFATRAIASGVDVKTVAAILGHSKCDITLDIYTTCTDEMMSKATEIRISRNKIHPKIFSKVIEKYESEGYKIESLSYGCGISISWAESKQEVE